MKEKASLFLFDSISIIFIALVVWMTYFQKTNPQPTHCTHCQSELMDTSLQLNSQCKIYHWDGKVECYCCANCGFPERMKEIKEGYPIRKTIINDYETGKPLDIRNAYYLVGSKLKYCQTPSVLAFQTKREAEKYQLKYAGEITQLGQ